MADYSASRQVLLPEKELRYFITVIVTADIDEGFKHSASRSARDHESSLITNDFRKFTLITNKFVIRDYSLFICGYS